MDFDSSAGSELIKSPGLELDNTASYPVTVDVMIQWKLAMGCWPHWINRTINAGTGTIYPALDPNFTDLPNWNGSGLPSPAYRAMYRAIYTTETISYTVGGTEQCVITSDVTGRCPHVSSGDTPLEIDASGNVVTHGGGHNSDYIKNWADFSLPSLAGFSGETQVDGWTTCTHSRTYTGGTFTTTYTLSGTINIAIEFVGPLLTDLDSRSDWTSYATSDIIKVYNYFPNSYPSAPPLTTSLLDDVDYDDQFFYDSGTGLFDTPNANYIIPGTYDGSIQNAFPSGIQENPDFGSLLGPALDNAWSGWFWPSNETATGGPIFLSSGSTIRAQKARVTVTAPTSYFIASADCLFILESSGLSRPALSEEIANVHVLSSGLALPGTPVVIPLPSQTAFVNATTGLGVATLSYGSFCFMIRGETPDQWSTRTGIPHT